MMFESDGYADKSLFRVHKIGVENTVLYDKFVRRMKYFDGYSLA
jgi:hypothetical protein